MKPGLLQCNVRSGDMVANAKKLLAMASAAARRGAEILVANEDALCGPDGASYMALAEFATAWQKTRDFLIQGTRGLPPLVCGMPHCAGLLIHNGMCINLPHLIEIGGHKLQIICGRDADQAIEQADLVLDLRARPFLPGWADIWLRQLTDFAAASGGRAAGVNLVGGYGGHVFQGASTLVEESGKILARASSFAEECLVADSVRIPIAPCPDGPDAQWNALVLGITDFVHKSGSQKCVVGLSGGMDSALVACLGCDAIGAPNMLGVLMPSPYTSEASLEDATQLAANLGMATVSLPISGLMQNFQSVLEPFFSTLAERQGDLTSENLQARIRAVLLMAVANRTGALVLNTGNLSEAAMGYSTLYGDSVGALAVLGDLLKTHIYELARWRCKTDQVIPARILEKEPSAELRPNQKDSDSLPPYPLLDKMLAELMTGSGDIDPVILRKVLASRFKRIQSPPVLEVGSLHLPETPADGFFSFP